MLRTAFALYLAAGAVTALVGRFDRHFDRLHEKVGMTAVIVAAWPGVVIAGALVAISPMDDDPQEWVDRD